MYYYYETSTYHYVRLLNTIIAKLKKPKHGKEIQLVTMQDLTGMTGI